MIYIVTLIAILLCAVYFDFGHAKNPQAKKVCYNLLLVWLICLSGFAYNVGADVPGYMRQYAEFGVHKFSSWDDLSYFENRQPGWMLLNLICSRLSRSFVLMKLIIAIFSNVVILKFIKKHTKYIFIGILLYFICYYLNFNFNSLRQTVAIAFFLIGYESLVNKKWVKYYLYCIFAFLFHSSAVICFIFPLFYFVKTNSKWFYISIFALIAVVVVFLRIGGADIISGIILENVDLMGQLVDNAEQLTDIYFGDNAREYGELSIFGIISMLLHVTPIVLVLIGASRETITLPQISTSLILGYLLFYMLDFLVPVVFMRFLMYLDIVYICALSDYVLDITRKVQFPRTIVTVLLLTIALYRPVTTLFRVNPLRDELPFYRQFYPYYSIFNPKIDQERAAYYGYYIERNN